MSQALLSFFLFCFVLFCFVFRAKETDLKANLKRQQKTKSKLAIII